MNNLCFNLVQKYLRRVSLRPKKYSAFTLVEMITTITITVILLSVVLASYGSMTRVIQDVKLSQKLQREVHFTMQRITDRMRNGSINYASMVSDNQDMSSPQKLILGTGDDEISIEKRSTGDKIFTLDFDGQRIFSNLFTVEKFHINISPEVDPYLPVNKYTDNYKQPRLKVSLVVRSIDKPHISQSLQTTISSRKYK
jgi:type II secretory pathway pseudopilin PulG